MRTLLIGFIAIALVGAIVLQGCKQQIMRVNINVVDKSDNPVVEADIEIYCILDERVTKGYFFTTDKKGNVSVDEIISANRYVVNVSKKGFAPVSKVFNNRLVNYNFTLVPATTAIESAVGRISLTDDYLNCQPGIDTSQLYSDRIRKVTFVFDSKGRLMDFSRPDEFNLAYSLLGRTRCSSGVNIIIEPNSLVTSENTLITDSVEVNISTVNLYSPDGMPGDNAVRIGDDFGYMVSYGAASVNVYYKDKKVNLGKGKFAQLTIPIDSSVIARVNKIQDSIPFLVYDNKLGVWKADGFAKLTDKKNAYTKLVNHFSDFNLDYAYSGGTCLQIDAGQLGAGEDFNLKLVVPGHGEPSFSITNGSSCTATNCNCRYVFLRLPPNTPIGVVASYPSGDIFENFVIYTGGAGYDELSMPDCDNYDQCVPTEDGSTGMPISPFSDFSCGLGEPCIVAKESGVGITEVNLSWFYEFDGVTSPHGFALYMSIDGGTSYLNIGDTHPSVLDNSNWRWTNGKGGSAMISVSGTTKFKVVAILDDSCVVDADCTGDAGCSTIAYLKCSREITIN